MRSAIFRNFWSYVSVVVIGLSVLGGFVLTDDAWPFAPLRMFSVGNNPNGVVRAMRLQGDTAEGPITLYADAFGLRRAELEEQTPWNRWVTDERVADLAAAYNKRHPSRPPLIHLQVVVTTTQMRNGERAGDPVPSVIGDWAAPSYEGPRAERNLPLAPEWEGLGR